MNEIIPLIGEIPSGFAARLGQMASAGKHNSEKQRLGQFLTPPNTARLLASFSETRNASVSILDPGAGTAVLSCALIEYLLTNNNVKYVSLTCCENDQAIIPYTKLALEYLEKWTASIGVTCNTRLIEDDYLMSTNKMSAEFDIVISNPPFYKLKLNDPRLKRKTRTNEQPNIYLLFMETAAQMLKNNGELLFLIPGSFTAAGSFRDARKRLLDILKITNIHRLKDNVFENHSVVAEPVLVRAEICYPAEKYEIRISSGTEQQSKDAFYTSITFSRNENRILMPGSEQDLEVIKKAAEWTDSLKKSGLKVSQGLFSTSRYGIYTETNNTEQCPDCAPVIAWGNMSDGHFRWSGLLQRYLRAEAASMDVLIPNSNYVLIPTYRKKKTASPDDMNMITAVPFYKKYWNGELLAVEKHVSYIHHPERELTEHDARKISDIINSPVFQDYLRISGGRVNMSADEFEETPLPDII